MKFDICIAHQIVVIAIIAIIAIIGCVGMATAELKGGHKYLDKKPEFLKTCHRSGVDVKTFEQCLVAAFQNLFSNWAHGVANSKVLDPLSLAKLNLIEDSDNSRNGPQLTVKVLDPVTTGLSTAKVLNVSMKENDYSFKMKYLVPRTTINGNYSAVGQISLLRLDTFGEMMVDIENGVYTIIAKVQLRTFDDSNIRFFDLKALRLIIHEIENVELQFSNLFKDEALTKNTNLMFNEQWRVFFDIFKPRIEQKIGEVLLDSLRSVFAAIPAEYFVADVNAIK